MFSKHMHYFSTSKYSPSTWSPQERLYFIFTQSVIPILYDGWNAMLRLRLFIISAKTLQANQKKGKWANALFLILVEQECIGSLNLKSFRKIQLSWFNYCLHPFCNTSLLQHQNRWSGIWLRRGRSRARHRGRAEEPADEPPSKAAWRTSKSGKLPPSLDENREDRTPSLLVRTPGARYRCVDPSLCMWRWPGNSATCGNILPIGGDNPPFLEPFWVPPAASRLLHWISWRLVRNYGRS